MRSGTIQFKNSSSNDSPTPRRNNLRRLTLMPMAGASSRTWVTTPFSSKLFSDLTHYVRSGDFVMALVKESQDVDEYAFALGALAHYAADISGHGVGVNVAVPILYPQLRTRFGAMVTYWGQSFGSHPHGVWV